MIQGCDEEEHKEEDGNNQARSDIPPQSRSIFAIFSVCQSTLLLCEDRSRLTVSFI